MKHLPKQSLLKNIKTYYSKISLHCNECHFSRILFEIPTILFPYKNIHLNEFFSIENSIRFLSIRLIQLEICRNAILLYYTYFYH